MISQTSIEKLEKEAFRGPLLTLAALFLIITGLSVIGLSFYFWIDLSETAGAVYSISLESLSNASPDNPSTSLRAALASRPEWLNLLPYEGLALILAGIALLLWRWVAAVRLRMTVSALILPSLRSKEDLDPSEDDIAIFGVPLDPDREAES